MSRVFLIHGWTTSNNQDWFPWAKTELSKKGYKVIAPQMPDTNHPDINIWIEKLGEEVGELRGDDIFVGHSLGCQAILRYLQTKNTKIDKVILIAGAQVLSKEAIPLPEDEEVFKPWKDIPIDFKKVKKLANTFIAIFSDNDPWVPLEQNKKIYVDNLDAQIIIEHNKGHFMKEVGGVTELPLLLKFI